MEEKEQIGYISTNHLIEFVNHPFKVEKNSALIFTFTLEHNII